MNSFSTITEKFSAMKTEQGDQATVLLPKSCLAERASLKRETRKIFTMFKEVGSSLFPEQHMPADVF